MRNFLTLPPGTLIDSLCQTSFKARISSLRDFLVAAASVAKDRHDEIELHNLRTATDRVGICHAKAFQGLMACASSHVLFKALLLTKTCRDADSVSAIEPNAPELPSKASPACVSTCTDLCQARQAFILASSNISSRWLSTYSFRSGRPHSHI